MNNKLTTAQSVSKQSPMGLFLFLIVVIILNLFPASLGYAAKPAAKDAAATGDILQSLSPSTPPEGLSEKEWASMQDMMHAAQYQFTWQTKDGQGAYRAPNPAHDLSLAFGGNGLTAARYEEGESVWNFGLSFAAYGEQIFPDIITETNLVGHRERIEYRWGQGMTEWYVNRANGVEHGLTLTAPPASGDVILTYDILGSLTPQLDAAGQALRLQDSDGATALLYDQLVVYDAVGRQLPAYFQLQTANLQIVIDAASAVYPLTVDPLLHSEAAILRASDAQADDHFGYSVAISGDTVVVGAAGEDGGAGSPLTNSGAAYVYERNTSGADAWGEVTILRASDAQADDYFGYPVAISGDMIIVGAYGEDGGTGDPRTSSGAAYIYERNRGGADAWGEVVILRASDTQTWDHFGISVAISGDTAVVGAWLEDGGVGNPLSASGAAYVYERNTGGVDAWGEVTILRASDAQAGDRFGHSVAISGDMVVVGADEEDGGAGDPHTNSGAAYIYERNTGGTDAWGEVAILRASDVQADDSFGISVAISGDTAVIGAHHEDGGAGDPLSSSGAAYVYERNRGGADAWDEAAVLRASSAQESYYYGYSVAISGDTIVIGVDGHDGGEGNLLTNSGAAYIYERNTGGADAWGEVTILQASDAQVGDGLGVSVAISNDTVVVGAFLEDGGVGDPLTDSGAAYTFVGSGETWSELAIPHASDAQADDYFGYSVAISNDTVVVGAYQEDGGAGDPSSNSGTAYVYARNTGNADAWGEVTILRASDAQANDYFGYSVAISGDTVIIGAYREDGGAGDPLSNSGAAYIYERNKGGADNWGEVAILHASNAGATDYFGNSVAISGDTAVVGAFLLNNGKAYVYERNTGGADAWGEVTILRASDAQLGDYFGHSVAISNDTVVVGADLEDGGAGDPRFNSGAAYIYERNKGGADNWGEVTILYASDAQADDSFGISVAISNDTVVVGAYEEDGGAGDPHYRSGAAYIYERNRGGADAWGEAAILRASDVQAWDAFGYSVAISGDTAIIGANWEDGGAGDPIYDSGAAYIYERNTGGADAWGEVTILRASDAQFHDRFGISVAISSDTVVIGANEENGGAGNPLSDSGAAYIYSREYLVPDLTIVKSLTPVIAPPGAAITYTLVFSNGGDLTATGVVITDTIPVSLTVQSVVSSGAVITNTGATPSYVWAIDDLAPGAGGVITISGVLANPLAAGAFTNTAVIATVNTESDTTNNSSSVAVTVTNVSPLVTNDNYATNEDTPLTVAAPGVLGNDTDANGDALTAALGTAPVTGTLDLRPDGSFTYTPAVGFSGDVTFTYTASDGNGGSDTGMVTITVRRSALYVYLPLILRD